MYGKRQGILQGGERGISLLEVVLVLAILVIMGGYTASHYHRYYQRGYRLAAITTVYEAALFLEKGPTTSPKTTPKLPTQLQHAPQQGVAAYRISVQAENAHNGEYSILAQPLENGPMQRDSCGSYQLDATGRRSNPQARYPAQKAAHLCWLGRG